MELIASLEKYLESSFSTKTWEQFNKMEKYQQKLLLSFHNTPNEFYFELMCENQPLHFGLAMRNNSKKYFSFVSVTQKLNTLLLCPLKELKESFFSIFFEIKWDINFLIYNVWLRNDVAQCTLFSNIIYLYLLIFTDWSTSQHHFDYYDFVLEKFNLKFCSFARNSKITEKNCSSVIKTTNKMWIERFSW